jgi:pimeloyl-ACP methyl ester carboxylesterase
VVSIPGTATWSPIPGRTPFDATGNDRLMAGQRSSGTAGVVAALHAVGVRKGEPVLLVGYSQGGLLAAATASDPAVRREFTVSRVITTGAPIAAIPVPDDVEVLSIEHSNDLVPQLDGSANPDAPNWVTVRAPAPSGNSVSTGQSSTGQVSTGQLSTAQSDPLWAHQMELYQQTAALVARSSDPSITAWRAGLAPFVGGSRPGAAWDVDVSRVATS